MNMSTQRLVAVLLQLLCITLHFSEATFDANQMRRFVEDVRACKNIPAVSLAVLKLNENDSPEIDFAAGYGTTDPTEPRAPSATSNTRFCIGSVTKSFTAGLAGKTVYENSEFKDTLWDTPIHKMYPDQSTLLYEGTELSKIVTLRDLLAHRTGITRHDGIWGVGQVKDRKEIWRNIYRLKAMKPYAKYFRSSFIYNNWMYTLVGHILEEINKDTYENQIRRSFFDPLGMRTATFAHEFDRHNWRDFATHGILVRGVWEKFNMNMLEVLGLVAPAGAICASANDMKQYLRFLVAQNTTRYFGAPPKSAIKDVLMGVSNFAPLGDLSHVRKPEYNISFGIFQYNLGTSRGFYRGYDAVWHGGAYLGYRSTLFILPDMKAGIFVSTTNSPDSQNDLSVIFATYAADMLLNLTPTAFNVLSACAFDPAKEYMAEYENKTIDFHCQLGPNYTKFAGNFSNPAYDPMIVTYLKLGGQLTISFGKYLQGLLCNTSYERDRNSLHVYFTEPSLQKLGYNKPFFSLSNGNNVTFRMDSRDRADMITVRGLDAVQPIVFYRKDVLDSVFASRNFASTPAWNFVSFSLILFFMPLMEI